MKGTRNLRQEESCLEIKGLILEDWVGGPKRESRSDGVAFGIEDGDGELNGRMVGDDDEAEREMERNIANLIEQKERLPISSPTQSQFPLI